MEDSPSQKSGIVDEEYERKVLSATFMNVLKQAALGDVHVPSAREIAQREVGEELMVVTEAESYLSGE